MRGFAGVSVDDSAHLFFVYISRPENEEAIRAQADSLMRARQRSTPVYAGLATIVMRPVRYDLIDLYQAQKAVLRARGQWSLNAFGIMVLHNRVSVMVNTPDDSTRLRAALRQTSPYADAVELSVGRIIVGPGRVQRRNDDGLPLGGMRFRELLPSPAAFPLTPLRVGKPPDNQ
ncbi:MAG TPA: hypothetical protein VJ867_00180 [Gemmatimonadaceae bacterium]|nr:hypothetical protein [Gemmatimonadaceae bacterium]